MKHVKRILMLLIMVATISGCGAQKVEYEPIDIAASRKDRAYELAEDVLFVTDQFNKGKPQDHCQELLQMDFDELKELSEDEHLSRLDQITVNSIATNTIVIICKVESGDYDNVEATDGIKSLMKYLKEGYNTNE